MDSLDGLDQGAVLPSGRRTRGIKVDYTSTEALRKADLGPEEDGDDGDDQGMGR